MQYGSVITGIFLERPNRFVAYVMTEEGRQICHVKNTGRCKELLIPGARVYLEKAQNPARKTPYDLIAVEKQGRLINIDAQAPNRVFAEWVAAGGFLPEVNRIRPEYSYGKSRLDFCLETPCGQHLVEVKGVTLERENMAFFPDAPTERGVRHIRELQKAALKGLDASLVFVVQMEGIDGVKPNDQTHPAFGEALREAECAGVGIWACDCMVTPSELRIQRAVPVILGEGKQA